MSGRGVVYIAYGMQYTRMASESIRSLRTHHGQDEMPVIALSDVHLRGATRVIVDTPMVAHPVAARAAKTGLHLVRDLPEHCLYMDADTEVFGRLDAFFAPLERGFDLVMCASTQQGADMLRHASDTERRVTRDELGEMMQMQAGVFAWNTRSARMLALFEAWREEWLRWRHVDQGALMRALRRVPVRMWLLGRDFNGEHGQVVRHRSAGE
jgi:hypothetical protein